MRKLLIYMLVLIGLVLAGCSPPVPIADNPGHFENISVETLQSMLAERQEEFLLINLHNPVAANIPGTDLVIPYHEILQTQDQLPSDKDAVIVLYCLNDPTSSKAAAFLVSLGYTRIKNLVGGINAWYRAGLPLEMEP
jgi:rhodanese-related sulfurtransferase